MKNSIEDVIGSELLDSVACEDCTGKSSAVEDSNTLEYSLEDDCQKLLDSSDDEESSKLVDSIEDDSSEEDPLISMAVSCNELLDSVDEEGIIELATKDEIFSNEIEKNFSKLLSSADDISFEEEDTKEQIEADSFRELFAIEEEGSTELWSPVDECCKELFSKTLDEGLVQLLDPIKDGSSENLVETEDSHEHIKSSEDGCKESLISYEDVGCIELNSSTNSNERAELLGSAEDNSNEILRSTEKEDSSELLDSIAVYSSSLINAIEDGGSKLPNSTEPSVDNNSSELHAFVAMELTIERLSSTNGDRVKLESAEAEEISGLLVDEGCE
ncbi:uncharacterized protein KQ657_000971 [Scheffersomyces spartinae]|uniref:Uncharacterized protein n=1 Tax=Scheffersomyces spartinae TaxID=45513 RepID=A0A9P7V8L0_9ASCO|nr:uncharacterized protein KQ657_000971 [Scheffersomyces spartinae]KAG7193209.1 hypothetical protein KQ657_000971 [Scheffersomyces spartinae]